MKNIVDKKPLVAILGPSAVGKTEIALSLAQRLNAEIVSADSTLIYRGMDIGTAKPSLTDRSRVPHHLIDVVNPDDNWSLADYQTNAIRALEDIHSRHILPLLVGGTGQYIRAILEGWDIPKAAPNNVVRKELRNWMNKIGPEGLFNRLVIIDPVAASKIDPRNFRRTIRALEVILLTGHRFSEQRMHREPAYRSLLIGLTRPRRAIYERVDQRIYQMIQQGLVEEVRNLLDQGYPENLPAFSAIGYHEVIDYLSRKINLEEAIIRMKKRTRVFIRHQANWFKPNDPMIRWHMIENDIIGDLEVEIQKWLNGS